MRKVLRNFRRALQKGAVGDNSDPVDIAVVVADEFQMADKCRKAVPSGKGPGLDQQSDQLAPFGDVGVKAQL